LDCVYTAFDTDGPFPRISCSLNLLHNTRVLCLTRDKTVAAARQQVATASRSSDSLPLVSICATQPLQCCVCDLLNGLILDHGYKHRRRRVDRASPSKLANQETGESQSCSWARDFAHSAAGSKVCMVAQGLLRFWFFWRQGFALFPSPFCTLGVPLRLWLRHRTC